MTASARARAKVIVGRSYKIAAMQPVLTYPNVNFKSGLACITQAEKCGIYSVESGKPLEDWDSMSKAILWEDKFVF